jgi:phage recombination protein Bet
MAQQQRGNVQRAAEQRQAERSRAAALYAPDPGGAELAIRDDQPYWTERQAAALSAIGVKDATEADLRVFLHVCRKTGLDPFRKQIYLIPRREYDSYLDRWVPKQTIQVGIDGFRIERERAADRGGFMVDFEETIWYDRNGTEFLVWLDDDNPPAACKVVLVKVYADGTRARYPAVLRYAAYVPRKNGQINPTGRWKDDPDHQLEKCCEAFASRKACPAELGGLYIPEEMDGLPPDETESRRRRNGRTAPVRATVIRDGEPVTPAEPVADPDGPDPDLEERREAAGRRIHALFSGAGYGTAEDHDLRVAVLSVLAREQDTDPVLPLTSTDDLDAWQAERAAAALQQFVQQAGADKDRNPHDALAQLAAAVRERAAQQAQQAAEQAGNGK